MHSLACHAPCMGALACLPCSLHGCTRLPAMFPACYSLSTCINTSIIWLAACACIRLLACMHACTHIRITPATYTQAAAALLAAASMQGPWVQPVLRGVRSLLQEDDAEPALLEGAMNAAAVLGEETTGAEAMVHDFDIINSIASAAFAAQPRELRKHALHALASIAGAQRAQRDCRREAALLSDDGERGLREAVVQGALLHLFATVTKSIPLH